MTVIHNLASSYSRRRFACLFLSLLVTMVAAPVLGAMGLSTRIMEIFLALNILAAVLVTLFSFGTYLGLGLLALVVAVRGGQALLDSQPLLETSQCIGALICMVSVCITLRFVLSEGSVSSERIYAALSVYLMVGIMCGLLFCIFEEQWPGSFSFQGLSFVGSKQSTLAHTIYFSFVTLGTLGYGDVLPVGGPARALAVTEAIVGQMYLVVVVARLVSLYQSGGDGRKDRNEWDETARADKIPQS
jgi:hypothetical protein